MVGTEKAAFVDRQPDQVVKTAKKPPAGPIAATLDILGGNWKVFILSQLIQGMRRFGELKKAIPGVTQKSLAQQLRELEDAGLVTRKLYPEVPPRVEYRLTAHGQTLGPVLRALNEWGHLHRAFLGLEDAPPASWLGATPRPAPAPPLLGLTEAAPASPSALTEAIRAAAMG